MKDELGSGIERAVLGAIRPRGDRPSARRASANSTRCRPGHDLLAGAPAWTHYEHGPWPEPHDPFFDFTVPAPAFAWLDDLAGRPATVLQQAGPPDTIAHADWTCGNVRFHDRQVSSSDDWDTSPAAPEAVLVGLSAGSFTNGTASDNVPTPAEATAFRRDYEEVRLKLLSEVEQRTAAAAVTWVLAYNARCGVSFLPQDGVAANGSSLQALKAHGDEYLGIVG